MSTNSQIKSHIQNRRSIVSSAVFILFLGFLFILNIITPAPAVLVAERRIPAKFPELTLKSLASGSFMSKFEDYAADTFVFRDAFRGFHSFMVFDVFMQRDMSGLYRSKDIGLGEFRRTDEAAFWLSAQKISQVAARLQDSGLNVYYSLIPDKSIFAEFYLPGFDLELVEGILADVLNDYGYISVADMLTAEDYYKTDLHWDQTKITHIADYIAAAMDCEPLSAAYFERTAGDFYGLYAGQIALPIDADTLTYVVGSESLGGGGFSGHNLMDISASYLSEVTLEFEPGPIYDDERFLGIDPYDFFLRGPQPLIILENDSAPSRELYLFRDSFGSSLAPLLAASYSKIYVIDLRYINFMLLDMFIEFTPGSDALFIYGSQILGNPSILQVSG